MHHIQFNSVHMMKLTMESDSFHIQQAAQHFYCLAHGKQRLPSFNTNVLCQWIPPRANSADDSSRCEIIECEQSHRKETDIARPVVDDTRANLDLISHCRVGGHGDNGIAHQP